MPPFSVRDHKGCKYAVLYMHAYLGIEMKFPDDGEFVEVLEPPKGMAECLVDEVVNSGLVNGLPVRIADQDKLCDALDTIVHALENFEGGWDTPVVVYSLTGTPEMELAFGCPAHPEDGAIRFFAVSPAAVPGKTIVKHALFTHGQVAYLNGEPGHVGFSDGLWTAWRRQDCMPLCAL